MCSAHAVPAPLDRHSRAHRRARAACGRLCVPVLRRARASACAPSVGTLRVNAHYALPVLKVRSHRVCWPALARTRRSYVCVVAFRVHVCSDRVERRPRAGYACSCCSRADRPSDLGRRPSRLETWVQGPRVPGTIRRNVVVCHVRTAPRSASPPRGGFHIVGFDEILPSLPVTEPCRACETRSASRRRSGCAVNVRSNNVVRKLC